MENVDRESGRESGKGCAILEGKVMKRDKESRVDRHKTFLDI